MKNLKYFSIKFKIMTFKDWLKKIEYWKKGALIGFIVGIIMSFKMMFVFGEIGPSYYISLGFILDSLPLNEGAGWLVGTLFFVGVYVLYGILIGLLIGQIKSK